jgi:hypothetical protein
VLSDIALLLRRFCIVQALEICFEIVERQCGAYSAWNHLLAALALFFSDVNIRNKNTAMSTNVAKFL